MENFLDKSKEASKVISTLGGDIKNKVLNAMAKELRKNSKYIIEQNCKDIEDGKKNNLTSALMDRLLLNEDRVFAMAKAIEDIAALKEPVGRVHEGWIVENGMKIVTDGQKRKITKRLLL